MECLHHAATPDLRYVPEKYHEFMKPSVQRIWVEIPSQEDLNAQLLEAQQKLEKAEKDNQALTAKCETNFASSTKYAEGEKKAKKAVEKWKKDAGDLKKQNELLQSKLDSMQA